MPKPHVLKNVELKLIAELVKNSRRSDRDLAKAVGVTQPTVSRMLRRLENLKYVHEYTVIPDFEKLGFKILAITFLKRLKDVDEKELPKIMEETRVFANKKGLTGVLALRGMGLGYDVVVISIHEDYSSFLETRDAIKEFPRSDLTSIQSFIVDLTDKVQYRPFTFHFLSKYLAQKSTVAAPARPGFEDRLT